MPDLPSLIVRIQGVASLQLLRVQPDASLLLEPLWIGEGHPNEAIVLFRFPEEPPEGIEIRLEGYEMRTGMVVRDDGFVSPAYVVDVKKWSIP